MRCLRFALPTLLAAASCSDLSEPLSIEREALNGELTAVGPLTKLSFSNTSETARQNETLSYYNTVRIAADGSGSATIASNLSTLAAFKLRYAFDGSLSEKITKYYNRGDLGIGREMHCRDVAAETACYVVNFAAGDDNTEFTFGLSSNIAFDNLTANHPFATVAMVFRKNMILGSANRVFFVVYNAAGNLQKFAALDRYGISFAQAFSVTTPNNPDPSFGTPGVNFNNHIPTNCIACHGGTYNSSSHESFAALFLPFDLDQFDYAAFAPRATQETAFKAQNIMVREVGAASATAGGTSVVQQVDAWYPGGSGTFVSSGVVSGWSGGQAIFQSVVRRSCRTCHVANQQGRTFSTKTSFDSASPLIAADLCGKAMPHSLQSIREFWFSTGPAELESYFRNLNPPATAAANALADCGPGSVATLDPPNIQGALLNL
jgi:hypothetical protein